MDISTEQVIFYVPELSRQLNSMKSSRAISHLKCLYVTDVSKAIRSLMMMMMIEMVLETSVQYRHLTRQLARKDFVEVVFTYFCCYRYVCLVMIYFISDYFSVPIKFCEFVFRGNL
jgi:phosphate starvation-inducible membrane PsiE